MNKDTLDDTSADTKKNQPQKKVPKMRLMLTLDEYIQGIKTCDRSLLGRVFSLVESTSELHRERSAEVINSILPMTGGAIRIGISGIPGVGKSTFIEAFGMHLIEQGKRVAVLAVDPSSKRTGGSIMGDKTRMEKLAVHERALVRPTPSGKTKGGVARGTRESILICEAAGFDVILIETVGVGQSETMVSSMVDFFLLLMLGNTGDELQGIKRGIIEMADAIVINKADGENVHASKLAQAQLQSVIRMITPKSNSWKPFVTLCSSISGSGIEDIWNRISDYHTLSQNSGELSEKRKEQNLFWMSEAIESRLVDQFYQNPLIMESIIEKEKEVLDGKISPFVAADQLTSLHIGRIPNKIDEKEN